MAKDGQAKVLSNTEVEQLFANIEKHRHPAKNALIMQISFKLGLRVKEISLLRVRQVAHIDGTEYDLKDVLVLPKSFTKGADGKAKSVRTSVTHPIDEFDRILRLVYKMGIDGSTMEPSDYYPALKKRAGKTRELPLADTDLQNAIIRYLDDRIDSGETLKPNAPLILSQKGGAYIPNTLQMHMSKMFQWTGIDRASSHSGRRTLATKMLHDQGEHLKTVQQVLGHKSAATTTIYQELPESEISKVLERTGNSYNPKVNQHEKEKH